MPDAQEEKKVKVPCNAYQIPHLKKKEVFAEYLSDCKLHPNLYLVCDESLFRKTWKTFYPTIKLRKYLKFAKCDVCVTSRETRKNPSSTSEEKEAAKVTQEEH